MALVVVTGSNGFVGTNVVEELLQFDLVNVAGTAASGPRMQILAVDLVETMGGALHFRFEENSRVRFVPHTELEAAIALLPEKPFAVIHNGACSSTEETNPEVFERLNLGYSKMLWNLCAELEIPFIYASSAGVYGDGSKGFSDKLEDCALYEAQSLYARSKLDFDRWVLEQQRTPPSWFGLRYFNVYGPHETHKGRQASMVLHCFNQIRKTGRVKLYKSTVPEYPDGGQLRDFVYVKDICRLTLDLLKLARSQLVGEDARPLPVHGRFLNIGTGEARSWNDLACAVFAAMGLDPVIEYVDMPVALVKQYQNYTCADLSSWRELGIDLAPTPLEEGVTSYVQMLLAGAEKV